MSDHGDTDIDPSEEINVDELDSRSCSPRNYETNDDRHINDAPSECSTSPPSPGNTKTLVGESSSRNHPFSISRLLGESNGREINGKSPGSDPESDKERRWVWDDGNRNNGNLEDVKRLWGGDLEEKMSEKDDDDTGSTPEMHAGSSVYPADLLTPLRLFPGGSGLIYTGGSVIRVPAHRPPGPSGPHSSVLPSQSLIPPWSLQALQHSQQQAAAAGLHRANILANLAAHPLQAHSHLKDRLAGKTFFFFFIRKIRRYFLWFAQIKKFKSFLC